MKKFSKIFTFVLLLSSIVLPFIPIVATAQEEEEPIIFRVAASALPGDWDPAISDGYNVVYGSYFFYACEYPWAGNAYYFAGLANKTKEEEWKPILTTSWDTEFRDEEPNAAGFNSTGGRLSITHTLREGVKFHDGSNWNATVMKWNIDRLYIITGNLTGDGDQRNLPNLWDDEDAWAPYYSESFNMSEYDDTFAGYIIGNDTHYPGVTADANGVVSNPNPYGLDASGAKILYAPFDKFPIIREVQIVESKPSGGKVKVIYNRWNTYGGPGGLWTPQISYAAYHKNYTAQGIYGYENGVKDDKNPTIVDHLIGTGPYKFVVHSETASPAGGHMLKNEDYWNKTALEADGWFDVDRREVVNFPTGQLGKDSQNTAILTHAIDYCYDSMYMPVDYDAVMANPNIDYIEDYPSEYMTQITLNCINETWWMDIEGWRTTSLPDDYPSDKAPAGGIPRALREAMSYAFDYDKMINTVLDGRAVRGGRVVGDGSVFYNESVPMAEYDLKYAREILLTTEEDNYTLTPTAFNYNFSELCADRGLTASSTDAEWQNVADSDDPIFVLDFYWDDAHEDLKNVLQESLANIGVALKDPTGATNKVPTIIWDTVRTYWLLTFDGSHSIWSAHAWVMDYNYPRSIPEGWVHANYYEPPSYLEDNYFPEWNFGFCYDDDINYWIDVMYMSDPHRKLEVISKIANKECNELYSMIWCYQAKGGACLWKDWEALMTTNRLGERTFYWGGAPSTHLLRYVGLPEEPPLIPGNPLIITLTISAISMLGIIYALMRKKKLS